MSALERRTAKVRRTTDLLRSWVSVRDGASLSLRASYGRGRGQAGGGGSSSAWHLRQPRPERQTTGMVVRTSSTSPRLLLSWQQTGRGRPRAVLETNALAFVQARFPRATAKRTEFSPFPGSSNSVRRRHGISERPQKRSTRKRVAARTQRGGVCGCYMRRVR